MLKVLLSTILSLLLPIAAFPQVDTLPAEDSVAILNIAEQDIDALEVPALKPSKDKVQYISEITRYGFKNLFSKFRYNPALPYSSQVNPHAEGYMQDYLRKYSGQLEKMRSWGTPYFNLIDQVFSQYGLPRELKYLAVIESNLQTSATSWAGAGGPWQFMPYTARDYGLVVNEKYDERRDYLKSTHAAARYLLTLYKQMHDWLLVIAAYNGGPGRVFDAMKKSGSRNFWDLQYYLPQESRNHVKKFIATHYVMEANGGTGLLTNGSMAGIEDNPYDNNPSLTAVELENAQKQTISGKYNSTVIAKHLSMELSEFNKYNPMFDLRLGKNGQFDLLLPADKMEMFLANRY
ncbi:MAG: hypothetical protein EOO01_37110, partial [Chitinophagaceae bacterium]